MSRKPVDKERSLETQEHIWSVIRMLGQDGVYFSTVEVHRETNATQATVTAYMRRLALGGYLECMGQIGRGTPKVYRLVCDSLTAPRVRKDGSQVQQGQCNECMWRSMRMLKTFSAQDLVATSMESGSPVKLITAQFYLSYLHKAGYIVRVQDSEQYRLLPSKITGPKPPQIQRIKQVYDPNINQVVWPLPEDGGAL